MPDSKECPLCGAPMKERETRPIVRVPGNPNPATPVVREWSCSECDYFEEAEGEKT